MKENKNTALLAVSFGTSYNDSRRSCIEAVEKALAAAFPDYVLRRAFNSKMIINKIHKRDGLRIDTVSEALERLFNEGFRNVLIQPTHIMPGTEYNSAAAAAERFKDKFCSIKLAEPLLKTDSDYRKLIGAITEACGELRKDTAIVWMGHGTEHEANSGYAKLQKMLWSEGFSQHIVATVEAEPGIEDAVKLAEKLGVKKVILRPLMIVAGDHANNDMAGNEENSWKSIFKAHGFETECLLQGLGELEAVQKIFVEHTKAAI